MGEKALTFGLNSVSFEKGALKKSDRIRGQSEYE